MAQRNEDEQGKGGRKLLEDESVKICRMNRKADGEKVIKNMNERRC